MNVNKKNFHFFFFIFKNLNLGDGRKNNFSIYNKCLKHNFRFSLIPIYILLFKINI